MTLNECMIPRLRGGENLVNHKATFSGDSKYIFVPSGNVVKVFSCSSGECVRSFRGHNAEVVSVVRSPTNRVQVLSCSTDCVVIKWDYLDGSTIKKHDLSSYLQKTEEEQCFGFYAPACASSWFLLLGKKGRASGRLLDVDPEGNGCETLVATVSTAGGSTVTFGSMHDFFAAIHKSTLYCAPYLSRSQLQRFSTYGHKKGVVFTCVTTHASEPVLATGDSNGCITLWRDLSNPEGHPARAQYHWHTLPVADLVFSGSGANLWSGGGECVLVKWHLRGAGEGDKQFLPRMGLPILQLASSPDNTYVLTSHADNCLQLVNVSQHKIVRIIQGMTRTQSGKEETKGEGVGLLYDPHSKAVVLNGRPGHLQFHLPLQDKQLHNLDIVGQNYMSNERTGGLVNTDVCCAAISGDWMATVEHWQDSFAGPEIRLKFWHFDPSSNNFVLNTNVYLPHYKRVNHVRFRTTEKLSPMVVTTGQDGKFRLWAVFEDVLCTGKNLRRSESWNCIHSGSYQDLPCGRAAFSQDGSLLALAFATHLVLWAISEEHEEESPAATFCHSLSDFPESIQALEFGRDSAAHLVVGCTASRIMIWNLITLSLHWSRDWMFSCLASDALSQRMAAFSADGSVLLFDPKRVTEKPLYEGPISRDEGRAVKAAVFVPSGNQKAQSRLYFVNSLQELYSLESDDEDNEDGVATDETPTTISLESGALSSTPFGALVAEHSKFVAMEEAKGASHHSRLGVVGFKQVHQLLNMYSHTLPWLSTMGLDFMASFLGDKSGSLEKVQSDTEDENDDSSSDMDVDEVRQMPLPAQGQVSHAEISPVTTDATVFARLEDFAWLSQVERT